MKKILILLNILLLTSCSSTQFIDSWKNEEIIGFQPKKTLIIGVTQNLTARKIFEENLKKELEKRGLPAVESLSVFESSFINSEKTEEEIDRMIEGLSEEGFDAVIITAVKGVDEKKNYYPDRYITSYRWTRFGRYYYRYQNIYYNPTYYNEYKVFHLETTIYKLQQTEDKSLVWVGAFNVVDPQTITSTVKDYINRIVNKLEKDKILPISQ
ncbi:hypothetical protein BC962_1963 [Gillisia mitskevichiae]|jgi:hypothetical protein|uniref:Uncharacterized protein n=1 Tax=Gillisia mitskevichiae TaxID=270921 RepID=A0A495PXY8_9FLAO|nr:hypothetical protein [Gillisia mitskevichiae]RKS53709.1 hypothetical protein BC962_1963 [Gillisia mitskevichiae]